uniref:Uncharacterized protein n=1 Tax=Parastrongyloides trichosuri TaxID=131310 RepID=A0A0N4ZVW5_PARTI
MADIPTTSEGGEITPSNNSDDNFESQLLDQIEPFLFASLFQSHVIPVRLKILYDTILDKVSFKGKLALLKSFGWTIEDYERGYIKQAAS